MFSSNMMKRNSANVGTFYSIPELDNANQHIELFESVSVQAIEEENEFNPQPAFQFRQGILNDITNKAQYDAILILTEAQQKAEVILAEARKESKELYMTNYLLAQEKGYLDGVQQGREDAQNQMQEMMTELLSISDSLAEERRELLNNNKNLIIDLAAEIAQKVIGENFMRDKGAFFTMFQHVVKEIPSAEKLIVTVSEKDYQIMTLEPQKLQELAKGFKNIEIRCDSSAETGTLRLETAIMLIDASMNTQIGLLKREVSNSL